MCLLVVDPRLLIRALEHQHSQEAKLLSLLIYGLACARAPLLGEEYDALRQTLAGSVPPPQLAKVRACVERRHAAALDQKTQIELALEQYVSVELLLVTSPPLRQELRDIAQAQTGSSPHVRPHRVNREIARCTWRSLTEAESRLLYEPRGRASREYLIHTAAVAGAQNLITDDEELMLPGNENHCDPKTRRWVRPYTLHEFCDEQLPSQLDFDAIDAPAVFRAARGPCQRSEA